ncbi:metal ABC transporter permease [Virgibacillus halodenitrificans]|jgi:zinc transport system permease protein|uniref:Metal ABC transporter permease n=1 Tax=Virgibacillus halodenitrificans TaxID=1482 RepID=A0ABR7VS19_VIRHA|nr:metal ABC transporter permease [Virgibacillus halodenitrificans]MBD1223357.1 metal ABC transporter permease [Virgibacillus halodenitrificans]MCG1026935.1 metal ABC transporter permease [Virgibacillus halodenitrificans]MCJ0932685.1 metal ABC transporter permease [Virgibacillus halodenitrificans]MEC2158983.1 metal ABC transporter permease [Virgibacillus halodenitrificans]MYL46016.1 iron chelate uptake ABC transporter family permease subunit [Virgibacillus halodenitrificans]
MLADFLEYDFLRNTFLTGLLIGIIAPLLGTFVVVRRLSLIADALSHVTLAGIAFGLFIEKKFAITFITPIYSGMAFSVIGSIFIEKLRGVYKAYQELAIPIILSGGVGLSVIFISLANGFNTDLFNYLFGSVSAVSVKDLYSILTISVIVLLLVGLFYKELFTLSFDEEHAKISGIHSKPIHFLFIILTALVIAASIRIVGVLLVSALMTLPVAASMRLAKGFKQMMFLSIAFGELAVIMGLISGYYFSIPPGGTIVVISIVILLLSIGIKKFKINRIRKQVNINGY